MKLPLKKLKVKPTRPRHHDRFTYQKDEVIQELEQRLLQLEAALKAQTVPAAKAEEPNSAIQPYNFHTEPLF